METIAEQTLWSFLSNSLQGRVVNCTEVRADGGCSVSDYLDLATKVAEIQYRNQGYVLLFRGQTKDYANTRFNTSLKPTLFRTAGTGNPTPNDLMLRFARLERAERLLSDGYKAKQLLGRDRLQRHRILRWTILQHYEVCATPLLDVTHSLRIAASFASDGAKDQAYVFVLGVPNLSGAITVNAESNLQIIRLSSVCPPSAVRPHIQEGYLLGEYPELAAYEQKEMYGHHEIDFGRRLIAKFKFNPESFWASADFPKVTREALYPSPANDILHGLTQSIQETLSKTDEFRMSV